MAMRKAVKRSIVTWLVGKLHGGLETILVLLHLLPEKDAEHLPQLEAKTLKDLRFSEAPVRYIPVKT